MREQASHLGIAKADAITVMDWPHFKELIETALGLDCLPVPIHNMFFHDKD